MKRNVTQKVARRKHRVLKRLQRARDNRFVRGADHSPVIGSNAMRYELSERVQAIGHGGIGLLVRLAQSTGLVSEIDGRLHLLKVHAPYQESDHVLAHVLNMSCGGTRLDHLELLRNDEALLNAVGADSLPHHYAVLACPSEADKKAKLEQRLAHAHISAIWFPDGEFQHIEQMLELLRI